MKSQIILLCLLFLSTICFGQNNVKKGYYIDEDNNRVECLIRYFAWKSNPSFFEYKKSDNDSFKKLTIDDVKEFAIDDVCKYEKHTVDIDRSTTNLDNMNNKRASEFKSETLLLKVHVEGKATLYGYSENSLTRFFYKLDDGTLKQLIYKQYINDNNELATNNGYKQQLLNNMKCVSITKNQIQKLKYHTVSLSKHFSEYNTCQGYAFTNFEAKPKRKRLAFTPRFGIRSATLDTKIHTFENRYFETGDIRTFRYSLEVDYTLDILNNNLAILFEPTYQYLAYEQALESNYVEVDFKSIELQTGLRYYFNFTKKASLFLNGSFIFDMPLRSDMIYRNSSNLSMRNSFGFAGGVGFKFFNLSLEFRQQSVRNMLALAPNSTGDFTCYSFILGYKLLKI